MKKIGAILKVLIFVIIFVLIFSYLSNLFTRKTIGGAWNYTEKVSGFYNEPKNEFDVMFFGSSNTYCSFNPLIIYGESGIKSYVLATQQQPVWASYTYIKEALKIQTPKLVVLDILMLSKDKEYYDDGVNYSYMDDIPFSKNKIELAFASAPRGERFELLVNFMKYHTRWGELTEQDYNFDRKKMRDYLKGYVLLEDTYPDAVKYDIENVTEKTPIAEKEKTYLLKIINLLKDKNVPLLLVKTPSNATAEEQMLYNYVWEIAKEKNIPFYDYNHSYSEIGLIMEDDFYDKTHLNFKGAEKFSKFFLNDLKNLGVLESEDLNNTNQKWEEDLLKYYEYTLPIRTKSSI